MSDYPNCEKLSAAEPMLDNLMEFFEWLDSKNIVLCVLTEESDPFFEPLPKSDSSLLMEFLGVDEKALDKERKAILKKQAEIDSAEKGAGE